MDNDKIALLDDRGVVRVSGPEAESFLDNLVTNDVTGMVNGDARFAALLTPQGKILFDFFVVRMADGYLLDVARDKAAELAKRLTLYKLRAKVEIAHLDGITRVIALATDFGPVDWAWVMFTDPRNPHLGQRAIWKENELGLAPFAPPQRSHWDEDKYNAHRIALGIPEGGRDFAYGDAFPHEAGMDLLHGVSFTKGCFVGQEVVARMQHKTVVRKRVVRIEAAGPLTSGAEVKAGEAVIGTIGSVAGMQGLAMLRLDRIIEALDKGEVVAADGQPLTVDPDALRHFRDESIAKAAEKAARI